MNATRIGCFFLTLSLVACGSQEVPSDPPDASPDVEVDASVPDAGCLTPCGESCCEAGETCTDGLCRTVCPPETNAAFCQRLGKLCGEVSGTDNCGEPRTVPSCGDCADGLTCDLVKSKCVEDCENETDDAFCLRLGKSCGTFTAKDKCNETRTVESCGTCGVEEQCLENVCRPNCQQESEAAFCARHGAQCGQLTKDECGKPRTVTCGTCAGGLVCDAATNKCGGCVPESNTQFCTRLDKECGSVTAKDNCQLDRTWNCGTCASGQCDPVSNKCVGGCESDVAFCANRGAVCGSITDLDDCNVERTVDCGGCQSGASCNALNQCVTCTAETDAALCASAGKNCDSITVVDGCGIERTPACGTCVAPQTCQPNKVCGTDGTPTNLTCTSPEVLVFNAARTAITSGNTTLATDTQVSSCNGSSTGRDLVYAFEVPAALGEQDVAIVLTPDSGSALRSVISVRRDCADKATELAGACRTAQSAVVNALSLTRVQAGVRHFIWIDGWASSSHGPFTLAVTLTDPPPPPNNDLCADAETLLLDSQTGKVTVNGDTRQAADEETASCATTSAPFNGPDVAYKVELTSPRALMVTVTRDLLDPSYVPAVHVRSACSGASVELACGKATSSVAKAMTAELQPGWYWIIVDGVSGKSGRFSLEVSALEALNNSCASPTPLVFPPGGGALALTGDTSLPGLQDLNQGTCGGGPGAEMVYSFTTTAAGRFNAKVSAPSGYIGDVVPVVYLRSGDCSSGTQIACDYDYEDCWDYYDCEYWGYAVISAANLPAGTYYLFADTDESTRGPFNLDVSLFEFAGNDECAGAERLTLDPATGAVSVTGDTLRGANSGDGACRSSSGYDLVYVFNNPIEQQVAVTVTPDSGSALRPNVYLRSTCDDKTSEAVCGVAASAGQPYTVTSPRLPAGDWYVWVDGYSTSASGPFSLSIATSPSPAAPGNDLCARPEALVFDATGKKATVTGASTMPATNDYSGRCATASVLHSGPDMVYTFDLAAPASVTAKVTRASTSPDFKPVVYLRKTLCESEAQGDEAACANESSGTATATQINAPDGTYYVVVDGANGTYGDFELELTLAPVVDAPDSCFNARLLDLRTGTATVSGDTSIATNDGDGKCNSSSGRDVVYAFTTPDVGIVDITVTPTLGSSLRPNVYVRSDCSDKEAQIDCSTASAVAPHSMTLRALPAGTYYVWVDGYSSSTNGPFELTVAFRVPQAPANDLCIGRQVLDLTSGSVSTTGTTRDGANDYAGSCNTTMAGGDVAYEVTIPGTENVSLTAKVTRDAAFPNFQPAVYIRGICDDEASELACGKYTSSVPTATALVKDLAPGTYAIVVDSLTAADGAFTLEVETGPAIPFPNVCASAQELVIDPRTGIVPTVFNDTADATADADSLNCKGSGDGKDMVYTFDTTGLGVRTMVATMTFTKPGNNLWPQLYLRTVCDTTDPTEEVVCAYPKKSGPLTVTKGGLPEGRYFLWVDSGYASDAGAFTLDVKLLDAVPNDLCTGAEPLTLVGDAAFAQGWTTGAAGDYAGTGTCSTLSGGDVVYSFEVVGGARSATATVTSLTTGFTPGVYIRPQAACATVPAVAADQLACGLPIGGSAVAFAPSLAPGVYSVVVDSASATGGDFELALALGFPEALPDACASAKQIELDRSGYARLVGDTTNAAADFDGLKCTGVTGNDLVYMIDTNGLGVRDFIASVTFGGSGVYPALSLRSQCVTPALAEHEVVCGRGTNSSRQLAVANLPAGIYYLVVDTTTTTAKGSFALELQLTEPLPPPVNVTCATAEHLDLDPVTGAASVVATTLGGVDAATGTCDTMNGPEAIYSFTLQQDALVTAKVTRDPVTPDFLPTVYLRKTICNSAQASDEFACKTHSSGVAEATAAWLPAGTHYVYVDGTGGTAGKFKLELTTGAPVRGDSCSDPILLAFDASGVALETGTTSTALPDTSGTGSCTSTSKDLVYRMVLPTARKVTLDLIPTDSTFRGSLYVRRTCGDTASANQLACGYKSTAGQPINLVLEKLEAGEYFVWVDTYSSTTYAGAFTLKVTAPEPPPPPANAVCATATPLDLSSGKASVPGETTWGDSVRAPTCDSGNSAGEVYYRFTLAQDSSVTAKVTRGTPTTYYPAVSIRSADCASTEPVDELACAVASSNIATATVAKLPAGDYLVVVDGKGATFGSFTLEVTTGSAVSGDVCSDAVLLALAPDADPLAPAGQEIAQVTGDTSAPASNAGDGSCNTSSGNDLVYKLELARAKNVEITVTPSNSTYRPNVYVRRECDVKTSEVGCVSKSTSIAADLSLRNLPAGDYYIVVDAYSSSANGPFSMKVTTTDPPAPPSNATCATAEDLDYSAGVVTKPGDTSWAWHNTTGTCASTATAPEVFYRLELTRESSVIAKVSRSSGTTYNPVVYLRNASCDSGAADDQVACATPTSGVATLGVAKLPPGIYYLVVDGQSATYGEFTLEVTVDLPLLGDTCADAAELVFDPVTHVAEINANTTAAKADSTGGCAGTNGQDLVYRFALSDPKKVDIDLVADPGSLLKPVVYLRSNCGETVTEFGCNSNSTAGGTANLSFPTLAAGTYHVWVDSTASDAKGGFNLKVTAVDPVMPAPTNDSCRAAEALTFSVATPAVATVSSGTTVDAVNDSIGTCGYSNGPDVAYSFVTTEAHKVTAKVVRTGTTFEPVVYIRRACELEEANNEVTCGRHVSGTATAVVNNLPAGTWYVVVDGLKGTSGTFSLDVTLDAPVVSGPVNESCFAAESIVFSGGNAQVQGTTLDAVNDSPVYTTCSSTSVSTGPDAVYSFDVTQPGQRLKAILTASSSLAPMMYVRQSCGSVLAGDQLACAASSTKGASIMTIARDLPVGTHYLWVDAGSTTSGAVSGPFTLDLNLGLPQTPANDTCANPQPLTLGTPVTGDTVEATPAYGPQLPGGDCGTTYVRGPEVVFSYTPTMNGDFTISLTTPYDAVLWYSTGTCDIAVCTAKKDSVTSNATEKLTVSGVAGTTYYIFADAYFDYGMGAFTIRVD